MAKPILAALLSCQSTRLNDAEKFLFSQCNPLGITLFSRNIENKQQLKNLVQEIKEVIGRDDVLIAVDQEGGRVRRLKEPDFRFYASQFAIGSLPSEQAPIVAKLHARLIAADLQEVGINVNFAPVLDTLHSQTTAALFNRCFSGDTQTIIKLGSIMLKEYISSGILPCIKHIPGHGLAVEDSHLHLPCIDATFKKLAKEFEPFKQLSFAPLGMTAHILLKTIDNTYPVTQSKKCIDSIIRQEIGFDGLLISDALDMKALKGSILDKAILSLSAGCDCVCYCSGNLTELQSLADNCPHLSDIAIERLDKAVQILHNTPERTNLQTAVTEYAKLISESTPYKETYDATEVLHQLQKENKSC